MKKPTIFKVFIAVVFLLLSISSNAQLRKNFAPRYTTSLNGDILVIGNNILNRDDGNGKRPKDPYNSTGSNSEVNDNFNMKYIDIDTDNSTYNSSSATLTIPQASKTCFEIVYAALYWSGTYQGSDRSKINQVKLKTPEAGAAYKAITGTIVWDEGGAGVSNAYASKPYACFKDITAEVKAAKEGVYTIADVVSSEGKFSPGGNSAGWSIYVIYKDPLLPNKYITSFDGFSIIRNSDPPLDIPISGFRTNPFGDVNVKLAFSALEGDNALTGDGLEFKGAKSASWGAISSLVRPIDIVGIRNPRLVPNFFNSTISDGDVILAGRTPSSLNTLGYDAGVVKIDNVGNKIIQNDETDATLRISTSSDSYYMFFNALSVEIIAPKIVIRKNVLDKNDKVISGQSVSLDQELRYELKFKNEGNDNAKNFTITDILPQNVIFNGLSDIISMDNDITATYDAATRTLVFKVPDYKVVSKQAGGAEYTIKFKVRVVKDCNELVDACSNEIKNTAVSKYYGDKNTTPEGFGEGSYSTISECNVGEPTSTNFLVGIDQCLFSRDVSLCGTAVLTAANGYTTYVWKNPNGVIFGGNNRQVTIDKPGTYTVENSGAPNCKPITQRFVVTDYLAGTNKSPIKGDNIDPATGEAYGCVRDNKPFPKIFLCGLNDKRIIDTKITTAASIIWQETKDVPPVGTPNPDSCPYEGATNWTTVENGPIFTADRAGVFRLVINYGNTCVVTHYFNVYQNLLDPKAEKQDIICNTPGKITVTNPPENSGYSYSLDGTNYQTSSVFNNVAAGDYKVQIRQTELIGGQISTCPFFVDVTVQKLDFTTTLSATHPICTSDKGTIKAVINNVPGEYKFILRKKGTTVEIQNTGLITNNYITFTGVDPGVYEVISSTNHNGCIETKEIEVFDYRLTAEAKITKTLTACSDGEITVTVTGGTPRPGPPPYYLYYINGNANYVTSPVITVKSADLPVGGIYNIVVVDDKGCTVTIPPITITEIVKPTVTLTPNSVDCYGTKSGQINVTVTPANSGYAVSYSVDNGAFSSAAPITNLSAGNHSVVVKYTYNGVECTDPVRTITIAGPTDALTASAGVSELAGCGPTGFEHQGKIRITNVQGGTPGYTYSFDNQGTWIASNEAYVNPGKYTVYVKDSKGCIYAMSDIVLDPKPADPSIEPDPKVVYNCDGTGQATVVVNNTGGANYTYEYYIDNTPNTPITSNVFNNVPVGTHQISVKYKLVAATTYSNLLKEDFGSGEDAKSPGISPLYCWERQDYITECGHGLWHDYLLNDGEYVVTKGILPDHRNDFGWVIPKDHTSNGTNSEGRYLAVNIGGTVGKGGILYQKTIYDIIPNQDIKVQLYALNLLLITNPKVAPNLTIELHKNGVPVPGASVNTADIAQNESWNFLDKLTINPGNNTSLDFVIRSNSDVIDGNDLAIDDILVYQLPKSCIAEKKFDVIIQSNKAFKVSQPVIDDATCSDKNDGRITIAVENFDPVNGFKYSINNGTTWSTSTTSPVVITGLAKGNYKVIVKNDDAGLCSKSFDSEIKAPQAVTVSASVVTPPTCTVGAIIEATAGGGTPAYKYELRRPDGTIVAAFQDENKFQLTVAQTGTFVVFVKDVSNCSSPSSNTVTVTGAVPPTASLDVTASDLCYDTANKATLVVTVNNGKAPFSYSLDGQTGQTSNTFNNVGPGAHTIIVTDSNGCTATVSGIPVIGNELKAEAKLTKTIDCTNSPKAQITITNVQGGTPAYTYEVSTNGGTTFVSMPTNVYETDIAGSYVFRVTDSKGCKFVTAAVTVNAKVDPTASLVSKTDPKCNNGTDGQFTVQAAGGAGAPFSYSFDGGTFGTSATYSGLNAFVGTVNSREYTYQVKDAKGCLSPVYKVTLNNPTKVVASANFAANTTCSTTTIITVSAVGGTGNYQYSFGVGNTNYTDTNTTTVNNTNSAQTITYSVRDTNGCTDTRTITVPAFNPPTAISFSSPAAITCINNETSISLTSTGGIAPLTYTITSGPVTGSNTTGTFNNLTPGNYTFSVTDARGCSITASTVIDNAPAITASSGKTNELCAGANNGTATFTVSSSNFTYTITPASGTATKTANVVTVTGLAAGTYTFVATDTNTGCSSAPVDAVIAPATVINFTASASKINCSTTISTITITGLSGGSGGYSYAYAASPSTTPTTAYGSILQVDTAVLTTSIDVYVKDSNNCVVKKTVNVAAENAPQINPIAAQCYTGTPITVAITGTFTGPATFSKDGINYGTSNSFSLTPGTYTLSLKDAFGCPASITYVVPEQLTIKTDVVPDTTCTPNTTISLSSTGGTGAVTYQVSYNGGTFVTAANPYIATAAGTYQFRVTDSKTPAPACSALSSVINVTLKPTVLTINTSKVDVKCNGASTGSILVTPTSGKAPYTYSITKTTAPFTNYTVNNPSGLSAGTYNIVVTDDLGCTSPATASVTITEPALLTASATVDAFTCNTSNTKESKDVVVTASGGTGPYSYSFNGGSYDSSNTHTVTDNGTTQTVRYTVKDNNGCTTAEQTITINPLVLPKIANVAVTPIYCDPVASRTSTATITLSAGSGTYTIVSGPTSNTTGATSGIFTGLTAGDYVFRVTSTSGCYDDFSRNIPAVVSIKAIAAKLNDAYCYLGATGNIKYDVSNFNSTYSYTINGVSGASNINNASFILPNLGKGTYVVVFTDDTTLCSVSTSITINEPASSVSAVVAQVNANCNLTTSKVTVTASGGTPDYKYAYMQNNVVPADADYVLSPSADLNPTTNTQWDIWVKDANGCTTKEDVTITTDPVPSVSAVVPNQCTASGSNFQIVATATSGVAPYTYTINTGVAPSPANTFTVPAGTYTITVKDANGCPATTVVTVSDPLSAEATLNKDITCALPAEARIDIEVFGGKAPFGYRVKIGAGAYSGTPIAFTGNSFSYYPTSLLGNTYEFEISDSNGVACTALTKVITTTTPVTVTASASKSDPTCNGFDDGSVSITATAGVSPFEYSFNGGAFDTKSVYGGLTAGTYSYQVRDAKGCVSISQNITLVDPVKIDADVIPSIIECNDNKPGSIAVNITAGGVAPFTYTIYNNAFTQVMPPVVTSATSVTFGGDPLFPALLTYGDYYVTIVDSNGCEFKSVKTRIETNPYIEATGVASSGTCAAGASVTINVLTAAYPVTYAIFGQPATAYGPTTDTSHTFTGLDHGTTYQFQVIDDGGCFTVVEVTTPPSPSSIALDPIVKADVLCFGDSTGRIDFTVRNYGAGVTEIRYEVRDELTNVLIPTKNGALTGLTGAPASGTVTGLKAGNYTLYLKEFDGTECNVSQKFQITQPVQGLTSSVQAIKNANCDNPAQVTLRTTGGTGPYTYAYAVDPIVPSAFASGNVLTLDPGAAGTDLVWNIIVKDANNCTFPLQVTIVKDPSPVIALSVVNKCVAEDTYTVRVAQITAGTGAYSIGVDSNTAFTSIPGLPYDVTGLHSGSHTIYIKDANGCIDSKTITIDAPLKVVPEITALPDCTVDNGSITLTPSGGSGAYTYTIAPMNAGITIAGNVISGLSDGTYTVTMTDNNNTDNTGIACSTTAEITLSKGIPVTFDAEVVNVACKGDSTGSIKVNLLSGNTDTPYTYAISPIIGTQTGNVFSDLPAGNYVITVTSKRLCSLQLPFTVGQPTNDLAAVPVVTQYACSAGGETPDAAVVTVNASGGTAPYKYNFDGGTDYYDTNVLSVAYDAINSSAPQTINYYVIDKNGCKTNGTATVDPFVKLTGIDFSLTVAPTCPLNVATITLAALGGNTPITKYEMVSPTSIDNGNTAVFNNIQPGVNYIFRVTDSKGCSIERPYKLDPVAPIDITRTSSTNVSCNTANGIDNNGTATFTVSDFSVAGYTVAVTSTPAGLAYNTPTIAADVVTVTGLVEGTYTVTVTDNTTNCSKSANVTITMPAPIVITASATKVYCTNTASEITVTSVTGGTSPYTYAVVKTGDPAPTTFAYDINTPFTANTGLVDLSWEVYVKDANGCIAGPQNVMVTYDAPPTLNMPAQQCFVGADLTVDLDALSTTYNGVKSFTINGLATGSLATFTADGSYTIKVIDDNGCEDTKVYVIQKQLTASATLKKDLYCAAPVNATIDVEIKGGVGTYTYQMYYNGAPSGLPTSTPGDFTVSVAADGDYYFVITDSNTPACNVTTNTEKVNVPEKPEGTETHIDLKCFGDSDGSLTITPSKGVGPYTFAITPNINTTGDASGIYTDLTAGNYSVVVTDSKGCTSDAIPVVISAPTALTANHAVLPNTNCSNQRVIEITASGGTTTAAGGYYYNFNNLGYDTNNTFTVVDGTGPQTVTYTVKDANGCEFTGPVTITINPLNKPTDLIFTPSAITCKPGENNSNVSVTATNGVGQLTFEITEFNGAAPAVPYAPVVVADNTVAAVFNGLPFGDYMFRVTDENKCSYDELLSIKDVVKIEAIHTLLADMSCNTTNDGKITFAVSKFAGSYTYTITKDGAAVPFVPATSTSDTEIVLTNLAFGVYEITAVDDITSCIATHSVTVKQPSLVTVSEIDNKHENCRDGAFITVQGAGGSPDYTYSFVKAGDPAGTFDAASTRELHSVDATAWYVYAKDQNGCISDPITVNIVTDPLPGGFLASATSQCPDGDGNYTIVVDDSAATGMAPFTYSIGGDFQAGKTFTVNVPGSYNLTVKDKFGCTFEFVGLVNIYDPLDLNTKDVVLPTCVDGDGSITVEATGGTGNYSYTLGAVTTTTTPAVFEFLSVGKHTIVVTDLTTNCTAVVEVTLGAATPIIGFDATATPVTCFGSMNGTITASIDQTGVNNNPKYMYSINGGTPQESPYFTGLGVGNYTVEVISGRGCPASKIVEVKGPDLIVVPNPTVVDYGCITDNNSNYATITVNGVTGGSGNYIYTFIKGGVEVYSGPRNSFTEMDYTGGTYTIMVKDDKECVGNTVTAPVKAFIAMDDVTVNVDKEITCVNNEEITVTVRDKNGVAIVGALEYTLTGTNGTVYGPVFNTTGVFAGIDALAVGNYKISVRNTDTGCIIEDVHYVFEPNVFELKAVPASDRICYGTTDGQVTLTLLDNLGNPAGPFHYTITGPSPSTATITGAGPDTVLNLAAGQYSVVAKLDNSPECTTLPVIFTIEQPTAELKVTTTQDEITCVTNNNDGVIYASAIGGWPGEYLYELRLGTTVLVPFNNSPIFRNLTANTYTIIAKDGYGCEASVNATLVNPTQINVTISGTPMLTCFDNADGVVTINTVTGGSGNYTYTLHGTLTDGTVITEQSQGALQFTGLKAGSYYVTVNDTWTCTNNSNTVIIDQPQAVKGTLTIVTNETCQVVPVIKLTFEGGTAPYYYSADGTTYFGPYNSFVDITLPQTLAKTDYKYFVRDANGCINPETNTIPFSPVPALDFERLSEIDIRCQGSSTGSITVVAKGGLGNYIYTLLDGLGAPINPAPVQETPGFFKNLPIGRYIVRVESSDCRKLSPVIELTEPNAPLGAIPSVTDVTCNGFNNGKIVIAATGGTGAYKYAIEPEFRQFFDKNEFENLKPGFYDVLVQDENECYILLKDIEVKEPNPLTAVEVPNSMIPEVCVGDKNGQFAVEISGGTAPYTASLDNEGGPFVPVNGNTVDYNGLTGGVHTVYIIDAKGCTSEVVVDMPLPVVLDPTYEVRYDCVNNMQANMVIVTVDDSNNPADVDYALDGSTTYQESNIFTNLTPGTHYIIARHTNGCEKSTLPFEIIGYAPLQLTLTEEKGVWNVITASAVGGGGEYVYSIDGVNFSSETKFKIYKTGTYTIIVRDKNGCTDTKDYYIEYVDVCLDNYFTPNGDGVNDTWGPGCTNIYNHLKFSIFDRYGRVIAKYTYGQKWDGRYNGEELPSGDYWYVLKLNDENDGREFVGHFTLYR
jgi:gliding motility-associated-like protein